MTVIVDVGDKIATALNLLELKMATFAEEIASLQTAFAAAQQRVTTDLANLSQQVTDLKSQVATLQDSLNNATLSPDQQAALDAVIGGINALDVPAPPPNPTPTPAPTPTPTS